MTRICHLFDHSAGWQERIGISQLWEGLPAKSHTACLATIDPGAALRLQLAHRSVEVLARASSCLARAPRSLAGLAYDALTGAVAVRFLSRRRIDIVHAWGVEAAWAARAAGKPMVLEVFDPVVARRQIKRFTALARPRGFAVACSCEIVRRRLIEGGLAHQLCVVIRPGVDFSLISECKRGPLREQLGLAGDELAVIVPEPGDRLSRPADVFRAVALMAHSFGGVRLILPGASAEQRHIVRQATTLPGRSPLICPSASIPFERLLSISDVLAIGARGDLSTTSIAWAFAAGASVIATAIYATAELVSNKLNGLLLKPTTKGKSLVRPMMQAFRDRAEQEKAREVARGHAYEVFGLRRYVDQHLRLYENLLNGVAPGEGIRDSAMTAV